MTTRNKIMVGAVIALAIVAAVLVAVGVLTHTEAGLLTACRLPDGRADYSGTCQEVKWDPEAFPLTVYVHTSNPYPPDDPQRALGAAVNLVNARLGFTAFRVVEDPQEARVDLEVGAAAIVEDGHLPDPAGAVSHRYGSGSTVESATVTTWNTGTLEMLHKVLVHELGHVLGLAHDDFPDSAMYPRQEPDGERLTAPRLTDHDRKLIRQLYADR